MSIFIYDYFMFKMGMGGGLCIQMVVIPKHLVIFLFNPLNNSLKSALQFLLNYVLAYRAEIITIVSVSKYILTLPYIHTSCPLT